MDGILKRVESIILERKRKTERDRRLQDGRREAPGSSYSCPDYFVEHDVDTIFCRNIELIY